jgi:hypothetical protein
MRPTPYAPALPPHPALTWDRTGGGPPLPVHPPSEGGTRAVVRCHAATGDHSAQHIILLGVGLARQEERQFLVLLHRLPGTEQLHCLRQVPYSSGGGITP